MAKKRRKPQSRSRNRPSAASTRTAERPRAAGSNDAPELDGAERAEPETEARRNVRARPPPGPRRTAAHAGREEGARPRRTRGGPAPDRAGAAPAPARVDRRDHDRGRRRRVLLHQPERDSSPPAGVLPGELTTEAPWPANAAQSAARATALGLPRKARRCTSTPTCRSSSTGRTNASRPTSGSTPRRGRSSRSTRTTTRGWCTSSRPNRASSRSASSSACGASASRRVAWGRTATTGTTASRCSWDGDEVTDDLQDVQLDDQTVIVVTYGTAAELPDPIPSTFDFSSINP